MSISVGPAYAFLFLLVFARIGTMVMILPGLGARGISSRARLVFALLITLLLMPALSDLAPEVDIPLSAMIVSLVREVIIGAALGLAIRIIMGAIQVAATTIAFQMGLGFATNIDPTLGIQGVMFSSFMAILATTLIFATDTHHLLIVALYDSYALFPAGNMPPVGDFTQYALDTATASFRVAMQMSAPFILFGIIFYLGMGVLSRMIPQIQVFFISMPVSITLGFLVMVATLAVMMEWFMAHLQSGIAPLIVR
ncbi:MAG: flagellar biosynthetic protein FliR [Pseudomonadota bacterium]